MYSHRARLGAILPAMNTVVEPEFYMMAPKGVTVHSMRLRPKKKNPISGKQYLESSLEEIGNKHVGLEYAVRALIDIDVDAIAYSCTSGSFGGGTKWNEELARRAAKITNVPFSTTSTAVLQALNYLKIQRLAVVTPYPDEHNSALKTFLEESDFEVVNIKGLGIMKRGGQAEVKAHEVCDIGKNTDRPDAEALFLACTNFPTVCVIEALERNLGKPVVSANQATMWHMLRTVGVQDRIMGHGVLLSRDLSKA